MLSTLRIKNYILIEEAELDFNRGFNVLTGETGAGKSIILDALKLLCGSRFSSENIGNYDDKTLIQGVFEIDLDLKYKIQDLFNINCDEQIVVHREINKSGKNICKINGNIVSLVELKNIMSNLVNIHSQDDDFILNSQLYLLDLYIDDVEFKNNLADLKNVYQKYIDLEQKRQEIYLNPLQIQQQIDMYEYQIKDIDDVELKEEDENIEEVFEKLKNSQKIIESFSRILNIIDQEYDNCSLNNMLNKILSEINYINKYYVDASEDISVFEEFSYTLNSIYSKYNKIISRLINDNDNIDYIENRFDKINRLKKKYGNTVFDILEYRKSLDDKLYELYKNTEILENIDFEKKEVLNEYYKISHKISNIRKEYAKNLEKAMVLELESLNFYRPQFKINFTEKENITEYGIDNCEFSVSFNQGIDLLPLKKVASGGEKSRLSLAIQNVIIKNKNKKVMIFDEIDTGISGKTANIVAKKMYEISKNNQIICVSHLVQVVLYADEHFLINKRIINEKSITFVEKIDKNKRIEEIARFIGLEHIGVNSIENAKNMLEQIELEKNNENK